MRTVLHLAAATLLLAPAACIFDISEGTLESGGNGTGAGTTDAGGPPQGGAGAGGEGAGQQNGGGGEGGEGGGIVVPPGCDPDLLGDDEAIGADCGIFVNVDSPGFPFDGSQAAPWPTFSEAADDANDRAAANPDQPVRIYICSGNHTGPFRLTGAISLYGGVSCDWKRDETIKPLFSNQMIATGSTPPTIIVESLDPSMPDQAIVQNVGIEAATVTGPGDSSIAVWIQSARVTFRRAEILSFAGAPGSAAINDSSTAPVGSNAQIVPMVCTPAPGALGGRTMCPNADGSNSATDGGNGAICSTSAQMGSPGVGPNPGTGGFIQGTGACGPAGEGGEGDLGEIAVGETAAGPLDETTFLYTPALPNADGGHGQHGSGGGGGGARGNGSGGGGGAGGCGGRGGRGGNGGGASFGIAGVDADITLEATTIDTDRGGKGGAGGHGARGGRPGSGAGPVSTQGCAGASGGYGGHGGPGGGGPGGPSACVAFVGGSVDPSGDSVCTTGGQAPGGDGAQEPSSATTFGGPGGPGLECSYLELDADGGITECAD